MSPSILFPRRGARRHARFRVGRSQGHIGETDLLVTEEMLSCTSGMLLCLDREQRLTFILGVIFEVSDTVAAEVLEITPDNFRQRLARARRDLRNFMNDKCGLVNQANPCRCAKKTRGFIQAGYVDPENLLFVRERIGEVREAAPKVHEALSTLDEKCAEIFRGHPFYKAPSRANAAAVGREDAYHNLNGNSPRLLRQGALSVAAQGADPRGCHSQTKRGKP